MKFSLEMEILVLDFKLKKTTIFFFGGKIPRNLYANSALQSRMRPNDDGINLFSVREYFHSIFVEISKRIQSRSRW